MLSGYFDGNLKKHQTGFAAPPRIESNNAPISA
jgi:hypothetical protein